MSDVTPLSGILGLSFDSLFLSPLMSFCSFRSLLALWGFSKELHKMQFGLMFESSLCLERYKTSRVS